MTVYINGTTGYSGPVGTIGDLTTTGNTTLGDATTDTLNVGAGGLVKDASGNVGIGTTSPNSIANYTVLQVGESSTKQGYIETYDGTTRTVMWTNGGVGKMGTRTNHPLTFQINSSEVARLDTSGNLGLGVTPSAWASNFKAIDINGSSGGGAVFSASNVPYAGIMTNAYVATGGSVYKKDGFAGYYLQDMQAGTGGKHQWFTAPSGTAGNAITFTQVMTLDASGNLGIGETSPSYALTIKRSVSSAANSQQIKIGRAGGADVGYGDYMVSNDVSWFGSKYFSGAWTGSTIGRDGIVFSTGSLGSETERARIDTGGNLLVGSSSYGAGSLITSSALSATFTFNNSNSGQAQNGIQSTSATSTGGGNWLFTGLSGSTTFNNGTAVFYVRANGGIANFSANNTNLSDVREKINISDAGSYLSKICAIPVKTFNYIDQDLENDPGLTLGVIAQDVQQNAPELVYESDWSPERNGSKLRLSIYQTDLQYALMKALQELKAEFDAYKLTHP